MDPQEVLSRHNTFAVVGATQRKKKFGYRIYRMLKQQRKVVFPVNPRYQAIDGDRCYSSVTEIEPKPEVVVSVVPPDVTAALIDTCKEEGIAFLWLQPGTYTPEVIQKAEKSGLTVVRGACILTEMKASDTFEFYFT
jgi:predicted CoA-binding protein